MTNWLQDYDRELEATAKKEMALEDAAWAALPQDEKDRIIAERDAKLQDMFSDPTDQEDDPEDDDDDDDEE